MSPRVRIAVLLLVAIAALVMAEASALAHDIGQPHTDPPPAPEPDKDAASPVVVIAGVVMTIGVAGFLIWAKQHTFADDADDGAASAE